MSLLLRRLTSSSSAASSSSSSAGVAVVVASVRTQITGKGPGSFGAMSGPDRDSSTMSTNPGQFDKSFERVISTIQERHPFQVVKGNPYDIQFGEMGYLDKQAKSKEMHEGKETEDAREKLRNRLTGEPAITPGSLGADPMQKLARERVRDKLDPRILKESKEAPEFYYENQSAMALKWDMFKSSGLLVFSIFAVWLAAWIWWRNDMSTAVDEPVDYYVSSYKKKKDAEAAAATPAAAAATVTTEATEAVAVEEAVVATTATTEEKKEA